MKKRIIILLCIIIIITGIISGIYIYNKSDNDIDRNNNFNIEAREVITIQNETEIAESLPISSTEEKTTSNTLIIYKTYYAKCNHYINEYNDIDASYINLTEEEFGEKNKGWKIIKFSPFEITLEKHEDKYCNQHYLLKINNGVLTIYLIDKNGSKTEYEITEITTEYLTNEDILKLEKGITIYGKENLISTLEDYE